MTDTNTELPKIDTLTPEQEAHLEAYRLHWTAVGRDCRPADRVTAERVFGEMYQSIGHAAPEVWWVQGPASGSMVRAVLLGLDSGKPPKNPKPATIPDPIVAEAWESAKRSLAAHGYGPKGKRGKAAKDHWSNLLGYVRDMIGGNIWWFDWGQHGAAWRAFYMWPHIAIRPMHTDEQVKQLQWWLDLSESCGWWEPYEEYQGNKGLVIVCERPLRQAVDARGRLHHETLAAMECRDGYRYWSWHGITVPQLVVETPELITVEMIRTEQNQEVRRVMIERYGPDRYVKDAGLACVDKSDFGTLYREPDTDDPFTVVEVINSTAEPDGSFKHYFLPVDPDLRPLPDPENTDDTFGEPQELTALNAVASTFGMRGEEYVLAAES